MAVIVTFLGTSVVQILLKMIICKNQFSFLNNGRVCFPETKFKIICYCWCKFLKNQLWYIYSVYFKKCCMPLPLETVSFITGFLFQKTWFSSSNITKSVWFSEYLNRIQWNLNSVGAKKVQEKSPQKVCY